VVATGHLLVVLLTIARCASRPLRQPNTMSPTVREIFQDGPKSCWFIPMIAYQKPR
jgi:hypothetical protein